jgi:hypothetical protein
MSELHFRGRSQGGQKSPSLWNMKSVRTRFAARGGSSYTWEPEACETSGSSRCRQACLLCLYFELKL